MDLKHRPKEPPPDSFPIGAPPGKRDGSPTRHEPKHAEKPPKK